MKRSKIAKIQIEYPRLRPDLDPKLDAAALRAARLEFCGEALGLDSPPMSLTTLSERDLSVVLDAMKREQGTGTARVDGPRTVTSCTVRQLKPKVTGNREQATGQPETSNEKPETTGPTGQVVHLAGNEQAWAIGRLFEYLNWAPDRRANYMRTRWHRHSERLLKPEQASSLLVQLLTIAASKDLKLRLGRDAKISRDLIALEVPALKKRLGIGQ